jgi:hypothetical protein
VRFEVAADLEPGEVALVRLPETPRPDAPALLRLRAPHGDGRWVALALGPDQRSAAAVLALAEELARAGRSGAALELCAAALKGVPGLTDRAELAMGAGRIAREAAAGLAPGALAPFARAAALLGAPVFEVEGGAVRYRAAFEALVTGKDRAAEAAALQVVASGAPCTPEAVAERAARFLARFPGSGLAAEARRWRARGLDALVGRDAKRRTAAEAAWRAVEKDGGEGTAEAKARLAGLRKGEPPPAAALCAPPNPE